jgi:hypothetical protein
MGKVGRWVTDPKAGAYCKIALGGGETIIVNHEKGGFNGGWLSIERVKFMGLSSDRVFACNLDSEEGKTALRFLTRDATERSLDATPLGAFVKYVQSSQTVEEVKARCRSLMAIR